MTRAFLLACLSMGILTAQSAPVSGPTEGFTFDAPTKSFRLVVGSLGSAFLGGPVYGGIDYGSVAPNRNYGIAFRDGQCLVISGLDSTAVSAVELPGLFSVPEGVAWSGDGSVAMLYSRSGNWIQTLKGFPDSVNPAAPLSVSLLGGTLAAVATDLHGQQVAIATVGENAGVFQIADGLSFVPLLPLPKPVALSFTDDGATLYALNSEPDETARVFEFNTVNLSSQAWIPEGLKDPVALRLARDSKSRPVVYLAGNIDSSLAAYDAASHELIAKIPLGFQPATLDPLGTASFLLAPRTNAGDPLWCFTSTELPSVYFVPAPSAILPTRQVPGRSALGGR